MKLTARTILTLTALTLGVGVVVAQSGSEKTAEVPAAIDLAPGAVIAMTVEGFDTKLADGAKIVGSLRQSVWKRDVDVVGRAKAAADNAKAQVNSILAELKLGPVEWKQSEGQERNEESEHFTLDLDGDGASLLATRIADWESISKSLETGEEGAFHGAFALSMTGSVEDYDLADARAIANGVRFARWKAALISKEMGAEIVGVKAIERTSGEGAERQYQTASQRIVFGTGSFGVLADRVRSDGRQLVLSSGASVRVRVEFEVKAKNNPTGKAGSDR